MFIIFLSASMEYYCNKDAQVALKIFEVGMRLFGENLKFVEHYLHFLLQVNEDSSKSNLDFA